MTSQKQLKAKIRARMAKTGERYVVARRHVAGAGASGAGAGSAESVPAVVDHGWTLRGGIEPDAAALTNLLANRGVRGPDGPISESLVHLAANGIGAGYILWEFAHDDSRHVVLGFAHRWQYKDDRLIAAADRLGVEVEWNRTGGAKAAAARLRTELAGGNAVVIWPDRFHVGYWHLPEWLDGHGGHPVIAYAEDGDRIHIDDRTLAPLTVDGDDLDRARSRVGSYQHAMLAVRSSDLQIDGDVLRDAVRHGLRTTATHLGGPSTSFALPALAKWSRLLVDERNPKAWPKVFADRRALLGALLSVWEGVSPAGMTGGNLRLLFADGLEQAADLLDLPALDTEAERWTDIAGQWHDLGEVAAPPDEPDVARARELTAVVSGAIAEGDKSAADRDAASAELWDLRAKYAAAPPWEPERDRMIMTELSEHLAEIVSAERAAVERLRAAVGPG